MKKKIQIFIMSMKRSRRRKYLISKLKKLNLKYKIFYGIDEGNVKGKKIVYSNYDRLAVLKYLGRDMGFNEIGGMYTVLRIMKYAVEKKLKNIIIFDDDFYPSSLLKEWVNKKIYFEGKKIVQFHCKGYGFLKKKSIKVLNNKVRIYYAKTHLNNFGAAQLTYEYMKSFLEITGGKVTGVGDYPIDLNKYNLQLMQTIPFLGYPDDRNQSFLQNDRDFLKKNFEYKIINCLKDINKKNGFIKNRKIINFLKIIYYLSFVPYFLKTKITLHSYYVHFFHKALCNLINYFFKCYLDVDNIHSSSKSYPKDLKKYYFISKNKLAK